jgi:hypothetical protein
MKGIQSGYSLSITLTLLSRKHVSHLQARNIELGRHSITENL